MAAPSPLLVASVRRPACKPAAAPERPRLDTVDWLLGLDDARFAYYVSQEVRRAVNSHVRAGLRDPRVVERWAKALRGVLEQAESNLADADRREMPQYAYWRRRTVAFRGHAMARLDEAERLLAGEVAS